MTTHKCSRDMCLPTNVSGPKIRCITCQNQCFLKCFGLEIDESMNGIKINLPNSTIWVEIATSQFSCCVVNPAPTELSTTQQKSSTTNSFDDKKTIINEMCEIKKILTDLKESSNQHSCELSEIKSSTTESNAMLKKTAEGNVMSHRLKANNNNNINGLLPPTTSTTNSPRTAKRRLNEIKTPNQTPKINANKLPKARTGTRDINIGPPPNMIEMANKPTFEKSIWISDLDPSVSIETLTDFITANTNMKNQNDFKCKLLVKKETDISKLRFISFKIDVKADDFEYLVDPSNWPKHVSVREFIKVEPVKLGAFINAAATEHTEKQRKLNTQKNEQVNNQSMEIN